jgi:hypothetical protein
MAGGRPGARSLAGRRTPGILLAALVAQPVVNR